MNLAEALPAEIERCRELIVEYRSIGVPGAFAVAMISRDVAKAELAIMSGDTVGMIRAYKDLRECE